MKLLLFIIVSALTTAQVSWADYVPGRTRVSAQADLRIDRATGPFERARDAKIVQLYTDGQGVTRYQVIIDGSVEEFTVTKIHAGACDTIYLAQGVESELRLKDHRENCQRDGKREWNAEVVTRQEEDSHLVVSGIPEFFLLSM